MSEVKWISEAYSMQPISWKIGDRYYRTCGDVNEKTTLAEIKLETTRIDGDPYEYYKGYGENGELLFEFKKGTVNVGYY